MTIRNIVQMGVFVALLTLSSYVTVPIGPVPLTLQVIFVLLSGGILGKKMGSLSISVWILLGLFGIPVFSGGKAGVMVLLGPTGGFLIGFIGASYLVGLCTELFGFSFLSVFLSMVVSLLFIYCVGSIGLYANFRYILRTPTSWSQTIQYSVYPFLIPDFVKTIFSTLMTVRLHPILVKERIL